MNPLTILASQSLHDWQAEAKAAGYDDTYEYVAKHTGATRHEVKNLFFAQLYGGPGTMRKY